MTIFTKGLLMIAAPLVFQLVFVAILMHVMNEASEAERWALHTKEVISKTETAYGQMALAQGASRGYVITQSEKFHDDGVRATANARSMMAEVIRLTADNPAQQDTIRKIDLRAEELLRWHEEQMKWVREGKAELARDRVRSLDGRDRLEELRKPVDEFLSRENALDLTRMQNLAVARSAQRIAIGSGAGVVFIATLVAAYFFGRNIAQRLDVVTKNAERLAEGELLAARVKGSDEIARLDEVMHESAKRLLAADETELRFKTEIQTRAAELARTNESLRQQTQENEMFVYSVSHDLRSPLVNLQGFSEELAHATRQLDELSDDTRLPEDLRHQMKLVMAQDMTDSLKFIQTAVSRSSAIIDALLRLSRAGRVEYRWQMVPIEPIVQRVIDAMQQSIRQRSATLEIKGSLQTAWGDPTAIEQVFGNLIGNAVNYLNPAKPGHIEIGTVNDGTPDAAGLRTYYVKDNGLGIPSAYMAKVFVAFQRLHGEIAKGEGIGLAVVRRMIERHGGRAWVESVEMVGSTFYFALPAEKPADNREGLPMAPSPTNLQAGSVSPDASTKPAA